MHLNVDNQRFNEPVKYVQEPQIIPCFCVFHIWLYTQYIYNRFVTSCIWYNWFLGYSTFPHQCFHVIAKILYHHNYYQILLTLYVNNNRMCREESSYQKLLCKWTLENIAGAIKNGQSIEYDNIAYTRHKTKTNKTKTQHNMC